MSTNSSLAKKLELVDGSYPFFVDMTLRLSEEFGVVRDIELFIDQNPEATASDVIKERIRLIHGDVI